LCVAKGNEKVEGEEVKSGQKKVAVWRCGVLRTEKKPGHKINRRVADSIPYEVNVVFN
jgi:hypothetical protein